MCSSLDEWHERLNQHFMTLHRQRGDRALFALEHGLNAEETRSLAAAVRASATRKPPSRSHSLAWIVYAAEIGYRYCGDEYWQTFELETPGWTVWGDRGWLRERYESFHEVFGGAAPRGPWANHFTIICWPITHAILPRDLQRQLARILYELRHSFSADLFESPATLGDFIAARSWSATSRFQNLAEEPELIGQIAAALLLQGDFGTTAFLHPAALRRISADLEQERMARGWLQTARTFAKERATVRGLAFARRMFTTRPRPDEARAEVTALGIEPRLVLRPADRARQAWDVCLEIPDLSHLLLRFPKGREVLTQSRCTVTGSAGRPLARGQFLYGSQRVTLARWPRHDEVLLRFDKRDPYLEALLRTECLLRPGPLWLFRIASDGLAYEVRNLRVRPGEDYIAVRTGATTSTDAPPAMVQCDGVNAVYLSLPETIDSRWERIIQQLGLSQGKRIEVWPAGLTPAQWDDDGRAEWLASETPCLAVRADHAVSAVVVRMGSGRDPPLVLDNTRPGSIMFVELPRLPIGLHTIRFATRGRGSTAVDPLGDLEVLMRVRESRPWSGTGGPQGPLLARIEPINPTLEQVWEGRAEIAFQGPYGRQLTCRVTLFDAQGNQVKAKALPPLTLPIDSAAWARHFGRHFQADRAMAAAYDTTRTCELLFSANELGTFTLRCDRELTPLRWVLAQTRAGYELRLFDDSGQPDQPGIARRSFERPHEEEALPATAVYSLPPAGGMYIARRPNAAAAIIAPPIIQGLSQFGCKPALSYAGDTRTTLSHAWADAELWSGAKVSGNMFSMTRQREVLSAIQQFAMRALCGEDWAAMEAAYSCGSKSLTYLKRAVWKAGYESEIAERLHRARDRLAAPDMIERIREMAWVAQFLEGPESRVHESALEWLAEFVLRVASDPAEVRPWAADKLGAGVDYLLRFPTFVRAARFLVVAVDRMSNTPGSSRELYATWRWR